LEFRSQLLGQSSRKNEYPRLALRRYYIWTISRVLAFLPLSSLSKARRTYIYIYIVCLSLTFPKLVVIFCTTNDTRHVFLLHFYPPSPPEQYEQHEIGACSTGRFICTHTVQFAERACSRNNFVNYYYPPGEADGGGTWGWSPHVCGL